MRFTNERIHMANRWNLLSFLTRICAQNRPCRSESQMQSAVPHTSYLLLTSAEGVPKNTCAIHAFSVTWDSDRQSILAQLGKLFCIETNEILPPAMFPSRECKLFAKRCTKRAQLSMLASSTKRGRAECSAATGVNSPETMSPNFGCHEPQLPRTGLERKKSL